MKHKVVVLKKLVFQIGIHFLIRCILDKYLCHLVDFKGKRDPLQQNGLQGQNQFWLIQWCAYQNQNDLIYEVNALFLTSYFII